jgi:hypothetical protein
MHWTAARTLRIVERANLKQLFQCPAVVAIVGQPVETVEGRLAHETFESQLMATGVVVDFRLQIARE